MHLVGKMWAAEWTGELDMVRVNLRMLTRGLEQVITGSANPGRTLLPFCIGMASPFTVHS